ncbi:hypothetical protein [Micromonospora fluostatini]|uniref:hypothetical protein n=1 Tax=Micromonospora sp. JCM 30529 TaxID=3421643 RepID=UPI003D16D76A
MSPIAAPPAAPAVERPMYPDGLLTLSQLVAELGAHTAYVLCAGCRSADARECAAAAEPCCDDCRHELPASRVLAAVGGMRAALDKLFRAGGAS